MTLFIKKKPKDYILYSAIILVGIILDQLTKFLVTKYMTLYQSIPLIKGFLHLTYTTNDGAAFGMMDGQRWVFIVVSTLAIVAFIAYLYLGHADNMLYAISLSMVISGGIGNMIDRLVLSYVVDFFYFKLIDFPVFNVADIYVVVGIFLLAFLVFFLYKEEELDFIFGEADKKEKIVDKNME